jgi:hypothetical protein
VRSVELPAVQKRLEEDRRRRERYERPVGDPSPKLEAEREGEGGDEGESFQYLKTPSLEQLPAATPAVRNPAIGGIPKRCARATTGMATPARITRSLRISTPCTLAASRPL